MERGEQGLMQDVQKRLQSAANRLDANPELSRRQALGALIGVSIAQGIGLATWKSSLLRGDSMATGETVCPADFSTCQHEIAAENLFEGDAALAGASPAQNATLAQAPLSVPNSAPVESVPPPPITEAHTPALEQGMELAEAYIQPCKFEVMSSHECVFPSRRPVGIPFQRFDTGDAAEVAQINSLLEAVHISPERYNGFKIDVSRAASLEEILSRKPIWPTVSVNHWVGYSELTDSIDEYIDRMKRSGLSYHALTMANGIMHLIAPSPHDLVSHALNANWNSMGQAANANSLATLTPEMLETMIYSELYFDKEYQRALTRENSRSHAEVVRHDNVTKIDWPSQLQDGFYHLKLTLNHLVYAEGKGGHPSPFTA